MRFRVPLRLKSTSSLALAAAASWLGVGRCLRLPAVSLARRGDQVAGLSADLIGIGDPAGGLNGGARAHIPFPRGLDGVAVAEQALRMTEKTGRFRLKKNYPVWLPAYAYSSGQAKSRWSPRQACEQRSINADPLAIPRNI